MGEHTALNFFLSLSMKNIIVIHKTTISEGLPTELCLEKQAQTQMFDIFSHRSRLVWFGRRQDKHPRVFALYLFYFSKLKYDPYVHMFWLHIHWKEEQTCQRQAFSERNMEDKVN